jgi:hypothetical protein
MSAHQLIDEQTLPFDRVIAARIVGEQPADNRSEDALV